MKSLVTNEFLTEVRTYDGEKFFAKIHPDAFEEIYKTHEIIDFSFHNRKVKKSSIKDWGSASDVDFIKIFVIPKLPWQIKTRLNDMLNRAELNGFSPSKNAILTKIEELQNEFKT